MGRRPRPVSERFWEMVTKTDDCWLWSGYLDRDGYAQIDLGGGRKMLAHRWSYEDAIGPIPSGLTIDHLCRVRACVNPSHLEPVTHAENMRRGWHATRTHCRNGHEYTVENTHITSQGTRSCRACGRVSAAAYAARKKAARPVTVNGDGKGKP